MGLSNIQIETRRVTFTDRSGTITAGTVAQVLAAENLARRYLFIQNNSDTVCWVNFVATAVASQPSIMIAVGASMTWGPDICPTSAVSIIGATTGKIFTAKEA